MTNGIILEIKNNQNIGLYARSTTKGAENSLVTEFIEHFCHNFTRYNKKNHLAVFVEPRIDSGYPDIVLASYIPSIADNWTDMRSKLNTRDLKLLSYLDSIKAASDVEIATKLGLSKSKTIYSLERLMGARLINYLNQLWYTRSLNEIFSLVKIVAVEAKINSVGKALEQTHLNTWFASHSYALSNSAQPKNDTVEAFSKYGVGLYCKGSKFNKVVEAKRNALPSSYISFQFNEWIGRTLVHQGGSVKTSLSRSPP